jgi:hypothetical protein
MSGDYVDPRELAPMEWYDKASNLMFKQTVGASVIEIGRQEVNGRVWDQCINLHHQESGITNRPELYDTFVARCKQWLDDRHPVVPVTPEQVTELVALAGPLALMAHDGVAEVYGINGSWHARHPDAKIVVTGEQVEALVREEDYDEDGALMPGAAQRIADEINKEKQQ